MEKYVFAYLIFINLVSAAVCAADKIKAVRHKRRVRERTLWLFSLAGGSAGMYITMLFIRHKTLHKSFMIGLPLLIIIQAAVIFLLTNHYIGHIIS